MMMGQLPWRAPKPSRLAYALIEIPCAWQAARCRDQKSTEPMITLHIPLIGHAEREPPKFNRQEWGLWSAYDSAANRSLLIALRGFITRPLIKLKMPIFYQNLTWSGVFRDALDARRFTPGPGQFWTDKNNLFFRLSIDNRFHMFLIYFYLWA